MGARHAAVIAHDVLVDGDDFTRTVVTVCEEGTAERETYTRTTWKPGWDEQRAANGTVRAAFEWYLHGHMITGQMYAEEDADEFIAFLPDGTVLANVVKTPRGRWKISRSDYWAHWAPSAHDKRFGDPRTAAAFVALRMSAALVERNPWTTSQPERAPTMGTSRGDVPAP